MGGYPCCCDNSSPTVNCGPCDANLAPEFLRVTFSGITYVDGERDDIVGCPPCENCSGLSTSSTFLVPHNAAASTATRCWWILDNSVSLTCDIHTQSVGVSLAQSGSNVSVSGGVGYLTSKLCNGLNIYTPSGANFAAETFANFDCLDFDVTLTNLNTPPLPSDSVRCTHLESGTMRIEST